jgi:hypothetical protein
VIGATETHATGRILERLDDFAETEATVTVDLATHLVMGLVMDLATEDPATVQTGTGTGTTGIGLNTTQDAAMTSGITVAASGQSSRIGVIGTTVATFVTAVTIETVVSGARSSPRLRRPASRPRKT